MSEELTFESDVILHLSVAYKYHECPLTNYNGNSFDFHHRLTIACAYISSVLYLLVYCLPF